MMRGLRYGCLSFTTDEDVDPSGSSEIRGTSITQARYPNQQKHRFLRKVIIARRQAPGCHGGAAPTSAPHPPLPANLRPESPAPIHPQAPIAAVYSARSFCDAPPRQGCARLPGSRGPPCSNCARFPGLARQSAGPGSPITVLSTFVLLTASHGPINVVLLLQR